MIVAKSYVKKITNPIVSILSLLRRFYKLVNDGRDFYMTASASHPPEASIPQPAFDNRPPGCAVNQSAPYRL